MNKQPGGQLKRKKATDAAVEEEAEEAHVPSLTKEKAKKKKSEAADSDEDEDVAESESGDSWEDSGDEYDLSHYDHLLGKMHYDPDDKAVFKCHSIAVVGAGVVVVYRCMYNSESRKWGKVNKTDPIHIADILGYHNSPTNEENVNAILQDTTAVTLPRGRPKKK